MKRIIVICAMEKEFSLISGMEGQTVAELHVRLSGMGKVNAALSAAEMISEFRPDMVINTGVAGSFAQGIRQGDTVIADRCAYHDVWCGDGNAPGQVQGLPTFFPCDSDLVRKTSGILPDAHVGTIITGDQFYISREEDERQKRLFPDALAVDMESAAIAQTCFLKNIPFLSIRVISDIHDGHQAESYAGFWESMARKSFVSIKSILGAI